MKISKDSWHYRFNKMSNDNFSYRVDKGVYTTCSYIRTTIASFFATLFKCFTLLCIATTILWIAGSMVSVPVMIYIGATSLSKLVVVPCIVGWITMIIILVVILANQIDQWIQTLETKFSDRPSKEPSVLVQAIIDKHNKFCTRVVAE